MLVLFSNLLRTSLLGMETFVSFIQRAWSQLEQISSDLCQQLAVLPSNSNGNEFEDLLLQLFAYEKAYLLKDPLISQVSASHQWNIDSWTLPEDIQSETSRILKELGQLERLDLKEVDSLLADRVLSTKQLLEKVILALSVQGNGVVSNTIKDVMDKTAMLDRQRSLEHTIFKLLTEIVHLEGHSRCQSYRLGRLERSKDKHAVLDTDSPTFVIEEKAVDASYPVNGDGEHIPLGEVEDLRRRLQAAEDAKSSLEKQLRESMKPQHVAGDPQRLKLIIEELRQAYKQRVESMVHEVTTMEAYLFIIKIDF